jgi:hypothetical protein
VTTRHKSVAAEETGHWIDETGDRPTRQTLDRGRRRRKKGKKTGNIFRLGQRKRKYFHLPTRTGTQFFDRPGSPVCVSHLPFADLFIHPRPSSTAKDGHTSSSF